MSIVFDDVISKEKIKKTKLQTANEKAGKHSGCMMWPGSNFQYNGTSCTFTQAFDENISWKSRVDTVIKWFTHDKTPANLVMLYFEEPDGHGHIYGPESPIVNQLFNIFIAIQKSMSAKINISLHVITSN